MGITYYEPSGADGHIWGDSDGIPSWMGFEIEENLIVKIAAVNLSEGEIPGGGVRIVANLKIPKGYVVAFLEDSITIEDLYSGENVVQKEVTKRYYHHPINHQVEKPIYRLAGHYLVGENRYGKYPIMYDLSADFKGFKAKSFKLNFPKFLARSYLPNNSGNYNETKHKFEIKFTEKVYTLKTEFGKLKRN